MYIVVKIIIYIFIICQAIISLILRGDGMKREILISRKKGEDGHKVVSVRMRDETLARLDDLSAQTNRSRNELINLLLEEALQNVTVIDEA